MRWAGSTHQASGALPVSQPASKHLHTSEASVVLCSLSDLLLCTAGEWWRCYRLEWSRGRWVNGRWNPMLKTTSDVLSLWGPANPRGGLSLFIPLPVCLAEPQWLSCKKDLTICWDGGASREPGRHRMSPGTDVLSLIPTDESSKAHLSLKFWNSHGSPSWQAAHGRNQSERASSWCRQSRKRWTGDFANVFIIRKTWDLWC